MQMADGKQEDDVYSIIWSSRVLLRTPTYLGVPLLGSCLLHACFMHAFGFVALTTTTMNESVVT